MPRQRIGFRANFRKAFGAKVEGSGGGSEYDMLLIRPFVALWFWIAGEPVAADAEPGTETETET